MENFKQARENRQSLLTASHQYLINVLASVLSLEESVAEEFILDSPSPGASEKAAEKAPDTLKGDEGGVAECGRTFPGVEEGAKIMRLFLANLQETDLKGLCLFFMKNNVNVAINPDNIHQEISFFTLNASEGVLKGQQDLLSKVYLPAIGATEDWGILTNTEEEGKIKQDFTDVVSNYIKFIDETRTMLECSQLSEPSDIDFSTLVTLDDMKAAGADADMVRKCEEVLMVWCSEIDEDCVGLFWEYQSCFHKIKEEILEQMPEGKIEVFEKPIFGKFERFCKRLQQISEMFTVVKTFSSLNQSKIERIDILAQKFQDICTNMKKNQDNALDHGKKEFEVEFAEFMLQINNLTHFHANKDDPPLVRNMPPVAGRILWVRNLLSKIEEPIRNIQVNIQTKFTNQMTLT
ncbi:dynein heavy chain 5, axonemal [Silurus meridionalis]|nr:dynein heavy chain 5, axonemal [Silurus meridionalis]